MEALNAYKALGTKAKKIDDFNQEFEKIAKNKKMTLQRKFRLLITNMDSLQNLNEIFLKEIYTQI